MQSGFVPGMSFEEYCAVKALNYSTLKYMSRSPMAYRHHADNPKPATPAMVLGHACHRMILEPQLVGNFAVWGEQPSHKVRRGDVWEEFCEEHAGKEIITADERDAMVGMSVAVRKSPLARKYLEAEGDCEVSMFWHDKACGRDLKGRIDKWLPSGRPTILDVKSTRDCRSFKFGNDAFRLGYHLQFGLYQDGVYALTGELAAVKTIAVESKPPYECAVFNVPDEVLQQGHEDYMRLVEKLNECERLNHWPAALEIETDLSLPTWAYGEAGDDLADLALVG